MPKYNKAERARRSAWMKSVHSRPDFAAKLRVSQERQQAMLETFLRTKNVKQAAAILGERRNTISKYVRLAGMKVTKGRPRKQPSKETAPLPCMWPLLAYTQASLVFWQLLSSTAPTPR